jgi:hypothetical protein
MGILDILLYNNNNFGAIAGHSHSFNSPPSAASLLGDGLLKVVIGQSRPKPAKAGQSP